SFNWFSLDYIYYPVSGIMWLWYKLFGAILGAENFFAWGLSVMFLVFTLRALLYKPFVRQIETTRQMQELQPQIKALQNQINAHFIYNVLESVKMMAEINEEYEIADAISSFGKLLRYGMRWKSQYVTVEEEIDYIKDYLALFNLRFDYEISLNLTLSPGIMSQEIPKMSLQPIVENAVSHGMEEITEDSAIDINGEVEDDSCYIRIRDPGCGMSEEEVDRLRKRLRGEIADISGSGNGIGLKNVQDRLQIRFGPEYGIKVTSKEGVYTQVEVKIPYREVRRISDEKGSDC
ncbi:MAG TPA: histidine kinase, partial [Lachnospiraceae bacterium]|nr:histidine kinase [Lachnospiraceae bacterium]